MLGPSLHNCTMGNVTSTSAQSYWVNEFLYMNNTELFIFLVCVLLKQAQEPFIFEAQCLSPLLQFRP